jgi:hypothetical protein
MQEFAATAVIADDFQMSPEERLKFSLEQPGAKNTMSVRATTVVTKARISYALAELAQLNVVNAHNWLQRVAEVNPRQAFELYLQLLEFSTPKLKAVEHSVQDPGEKNMKDVPLADLMRLIQGNVVSSQ